MITARACDRVLKSRGCDMITAPASGHLSYFLFFLFILSHCEQHAASDR